MQIEISARPSEPGAAEPAERVLIPTPTAGITPQTHLLHLLLAAGPYLKSGCEWEARCVAACRSPIRLKLLLYAQRVFMGPDPLGGAAGPEPRGRARVMWSSQPSRATRMRIPRNSDLILQTEDRGKSSLRAKNSQGTG